MGDIKEIITDESDGTEPPVKNKEKDHHQIPVCLGITKGKLLLWLAIEIEQ